jgi:protocatechuate 3,4-dioxygenase, beta subunit
MRLPRRRVIEVAIAGAAAFGFPGLLRAEALPPTPEQTAGPFYPQSFPADSDNDLVHVAGHAEPAKGTLTRVSGHILDREGRPLSGARVEIWQCDQNGRYHHVGDGGGGRKPDENFQGFGRTVTDAAGTYDFTTIRPVSYPGRTPHIHFGVVAPDLAPFVTQMYVAGESLNERDPVLRGVRDPADRARLIVPLRPAPEIGPEALAGKFDIVIG